jgi:Domain of unknown function (DUF4301)
MTNWKFRPEDLRLISEWGISESQVLAQIDLFQKSSAHLTLHRPCTLGDGIRKIPGTETESLIGLQKEAALEGRIIKFVPASGAATRMFGELLPPYLNRSSLRSEENDSILIPKDPKDGPLLRFLTGIERFAFFKDLKEAMARDGKGISTPFPLRQWGDVLEYFLTERGLNYLNLPKGLHKFHKYPGKNRTAFEEHLIEAIQTVCDRTGRCRLHLTVAPEHEKFIKAFFETLRPDYEKEYHCRIQVDFSVQSHSTKTLAVDLEDIPFRDEEGNLVFRPGGHGALLQNLNDLQADLIYIKNIDNVLPDRLKGPAIFWKKILGGYLVRIQQTIHGFLRNLEEEKEIPTLMNRIGIFCRNQLWISEPSDLRKRSFQEQKTYWLGILNRPIRVCGMVKNEGEPGGGPFWVKDSEERISLQIVEKAQIEPESADQQAIWNSSTHFNPVDLVCSVRDFEGRPFDLNRFRNPEAVFITRKSHNGRDLKALELPGLWNGGMAQWITLFVEVPDQTFSPVKMINDLLRPDHQSEGN